MPKETERSLDSISLYSEQLDQIELLDREGGEEADLMKRIQAGREATDILANEELAAHYDASELEAIIENSESAKHKLIEANLRLVPYFAKRYHGSGIGYEDLVQTGNLGLSRCAELADPEHGYAFSTYAAHYIARYMEKEIKERSSGMRVPIYAMNVFLQHEKQPDTIDPELEQKLHRSSTGKISLLHGIAIAQGCTTFSDMEASKEYHKRRSAIAGRPGGVNPEDEQLEDLTIEDILGGSMTENTETAAIRSLEQEEIQYEISRLPEQEALVLKMRFGLAGEQPRILDEIGESLGVSGEWVRQIEARALSKLRDPEQFPLLHADRDDIKPPPETRPETETEALQYIFAYWTDDMLAFKLEEIMEQAGVLGVFTELVKHRSDARALNTYHARHGIPLLEQLAPDAEQIITNRSMAYWQKVLKKERRQMYGQMHRRYSVIKPVVSPDTYHATFSAEPGSKDHSYTLQRILLSAYGNPEEFIKRVSVSARFERQ